MRLRAYTPFVPGEYPYEQTVKGVTYKFPAEGVDIYTQASRVFKFRKANNFPRASLQESLDDIDTYTCQRLGGDNRWCDDGTSPSPRQLVKSEGCRGCGLKV